MASPFAGNGLLPKHPELSSMKHSEPNCCARPQTTRSPEGRDPVRTETPASTTDGPTVGANCRGGGTAGARGSSCWGPEGRWGNRRREVRYRAHCGTANNTNTHEEHKHETSTQRSTQLRGSRKVIIPLLLHLWCIWYGSHKSYNCVHPLGFLWK